MAGDEVPGGQGADSSAKERLRRVEGQVRGIYRMVEERRPCVDIVTQLLAARAALDRVLEEVVTSHVDECLATLPAEQARVSVARAVKMLSRSK